VHAVLQHSGVSARAAALQHALRGETPREAGPQAVLADARNTWRPIDSPHPRGAVGHRRLGLRHGRRGGVSRAQAIAGLRTRGGPPGLQPLPQRVWEQAGDDPGAAELPDPTVRGGMRTRLTGCGVEVPLSRGALLVGQSARRAARVASLVCPATPGLPRCSRTRCHARMRCGRSHTSSSNRAALAGCSGGHSARRRARPGWPVPGAAPPPAAMQASGHGWSGMCCRCRRLRRASDVPLPLVQACTQRARCGLAVVRPLRLPVPPEPRRLPGLRGPLRTVASRAGRLAASSISWRRHDADLPREVRSPAPHPCRLSRRRP
jgi:hypothetical protein